MYVRAAFSLFTILAFGQDGERKYSLYQMYFCCCSTMPIRSGDQGGVDVTVLTMQPNTPASSADSACTVAGAGDKEDKSRMKVNFFVPTVVI